MPTFLMFGKYSAQAIKEASPERTQAAEALIKKLGGEIKAAYALLGETDLLAVVELPSIEAAVQASVALGKMTGIAFTTCPAIPMAEFDKIIAAG
ncbi:MAG: GYD domain-containing protein [Syntrophales bacterium]|nr:GYD domain-containing protein [Syntrophales bacterium]